MMGTLYLVATPIGNLADITARAVRVLSQVPLIAAEDTRHTAKLLSHLGIQARLLSYYEHSKLSRLEAILEALGQGDVALVSDAGTPALNDPGYLLVQAALEAGHRVVPIPGASAPLAALVASGLPTDRFTYLGYLPRRKSERRISLQEVCGLPYTLVFLEAPHRLVAALQDILDILGDRRLAVARELTKLHEEILRNTVSEALAHFQQTPPRGEITLVLSGASPDLPAWTIEQVESAIRQRLTAGETAPNIARDLATEAHWPRRQIYDLVSRFQKQ
jgi:16S rRNA (cytidine1402-2'-O)-methyltransferase